LIDAATSVCRVGKSKSYWRPCHYLSKDL